MHNSPQITCSLASANFTSWDLCRPKCFTGDVGDIASHLGVSKTPAWTVSPWEADVIGQSPCAWRSGCGMHVRSPRARTWCLWWKEGLEVLIGDSFFWCFGCSINTSILKSSGLLSKIVLKEINLRLEITSCSSSAFAFAARLSRQQRGIRKFRFPFI